MPFPWKLSRIILQWSLLPPININLNFPQRRWPPAKTFTFRPQPTPSLAELEAEAKARDKKFDPKRKMTPLSVRLIKASNAFWRDKT